MVGLTRSGRDGNDYLGGGLGLEFVKSSKQQAAIISSRDLGGALDLWTNFCCLVVADVKECNARLGFLQWSWLSLHLEFILKGLGMRIQTLSYKVGWLARLMDNEAVVITLLIATLLSLPRPLPSRFCLYLYLPNLVISLTLEILWYLMVSNTYIA